MVTAVFMAKTPCHTRSHEGPEPLWSAVGDVDSSGHVRKAHEDVEVESAVGVPRLRGGEDLPEHLTPPDHRPEHRRAHARCLEDLAKIRRLIRIRENHGTLFMHHLSWVTKVDGNAQAVLLRRKPLLGDQEIILTVWCDEEDARVSELALSSAESAWTEMRLFVSQDLLRPSRKVPKRTLDVRRGVGRPCRLCEPCQRQCLQRVDITLRHRASLYG